MERLINFIFEKKELLITNLIGHNWYKKINLGF